MVDDEYPAREEGEEHEGIEYAEERVHRLRFFI